jgi:hypothetical protein
MPIQQGQTLSFRSDIVQGDQDLSANTLKMALYTAYATLNPSTTAYVEDDPNEVVGTGYTAGGNTITGVTINTDISTNTVFINFDNVSWPGASFTARGALIYNVTQSNKSIAVLDFGSDKIFSSVSNTITMPVNSATTALLRFV